MASGSVLTQTYYSVTPSEGPHSEITPSLTPRAAPAPSFNSNPKTDHHLTFNDTISSSELESPSDTPTPQDGLNIYSPNSPGEADAEGSPDIEFEADTSPAPNEEHVDDAGSASGHSSRPGKRKSDVDDDEYIRSHPELYGLRRSGRARAAHRVIDSSDEDEDDASDIDARPALKRRKITTSRKASKNPSPAPPSDSPSDSDTDAYGGARARANTKKQRRRLMQVAAGNASPSQAEVRFSTRRAAKVSTYNEDEDEDEFAMEEDLENVTPNYWKAEDDSPAIDRVLDHRRKEGITKQYPEEEDFEYFIKWQGKAYYHATWEPWSVVSSLRGSKKAKNYWMNIVERETDMNNDPDFSLDDKEKYILDRESQRDAVVEYTQVERVIDTQEGTVGTEYFVKWRGLFYDSCTWESAALISQLAQHEIDRYLDRSSRLPVSNKVESNVHTRSAYKPFRDQPSYIKNGELREFQIKGVNFLAHNWCQDHSVILADEMGLGKTVQTVAFISWLYHERQQQGPCIVVVPLSTLPAWAETFNHWTPDINYVVYTGNEAARATIREKELFVDGNPRKLKFNVLLTTYDYITIKGSWTWELQQIKWQFLAVDEAHRLKNRESGLYGKLMDLGAPSRLLITGTPVQNNLGELSALMHFLMPGQIIVDEDIDLQSEEASKKLAELTSSIAPFIIRRTKKLVEKDLPPKTEKIIRVELSDVQLEYYKNILTRNYTALNQGGRGHRTSLLNIMMELKKASNHPFMFPGAEERMLAGSERRDDVLKALITSSGKMMVLDQLLTKMKKDGHRVLIFSQMVRMLDILGDYLHLRGYQFQRLDGMIGAPARRRSIDHFNATDSRDFAFILSTRAGGLGINLMTADTVILFDSDWNPQADLQAMARAHRIGQKSPVTVYRLVSKDTVEEEVLERARNKLMLEFITIQRGVTDKDAKDLTNKLKRSVNAPDDADDINKILKRRGQKMFEQSGNQKRLEELDIDAVLENAEEHATEQPEGLAADGGEEFLKNFEYTDVKVDLEWDQIIPKEHLEEIKAEEKKREEAKYLASVIEQNAPRKRKATSNEREQRAAKKRARDLAAADAADDESSSDSDKDPKRPLDEKEIRNLIRAYERYGSLDDRGEELIKDAKLVGRDIELLRATLADVIDISEKALQQERDRLTALHRNENKAPTKKDKKAILFDYHGVKRLNAETLIERPIEMRMLREVMELTSDYKSFRVPEATKGASYTCDWGAREDGMLCVGIFRHGYGAWVAIRDDTDLGLGDKFFLEEHQVAQKEERNKAEKSENKSVRSPGAVHLVRRSNYLLSVLKDKTSNGTNEAAKRALENHHRNNKKNAAASRLSEVSGRPSASPAPGAVRRPHRDSDSAGQGNHERSERQPSHLRNSFDRHSMKRQSSEQLESERKKIPRTAMEYKDGDRRTMKRQSSEQLDADRRKIPRSVLNHKDADRRPMKRQSSEQLETERKKVTRTLMEHKDTERHRSDRYSPAERERKDRHLTNGDGRSPALAANKPSNSQDSHRKHHDQGKKVEHGAEPANGNAHEDERMEKLFQPQRKQLERLQIVKRSKDNDEKLTIMKDVLKRINKHILESVAADVTLDEEHCWDYFSAHHWLKKETKGTQLKKIVERALLDEAKPAVQTSPTEVG